MNEEILRPGGARQLECNLLIVEHYVRCEFNNENAFFLRSRLATDKNEKAENLEAARYFESRKVNAQNEASNLREAIAAA